MSVASLIIGEMHILIITTTPTIPTAFFSILLQLITVSSESPNILPTIGIKFDTAAFVVFTVSPSTPFVMLPSSEETPTNIVNAIPKHQTTELFINFGNLSICTLSEILDIILSAIDISVAGINIVLIKFPIKVIINKIIGCNMLADAIFPSSYH